MWVDDADLRLLGEIVAARTMPLLDDYGAEFEAVLADLERRNVRGAAGLAMRALRCAELVACEFTEAEVATLVGCSERSVRSDLSLLRRVLEPEREAAA
jgi:hypothetical protein